MSISVIVSNRTDIRQGWKVVALEMPDDDWNSLGRRLAEYTRIRTEKSARKLAADLAKQYGCQVL